MPRPCCPRRVTHTPPVGYFKPAGVPLCELQEVALAADELEALRLADVEELYHAEAAARMRVSRQTFDRIVLRARRKVARALTQGLALRLEATGGPGRGAEPARATRAGRCGRSRGGGKKPAGRA